MRNNWKNILMYIGVPALVIALATLLGACANAPTTRAQTQAVLSGSVSVTDYGAIPDDGLDDRIAIQAAINSGAAEVVIPEGTYDLTQGPGFYNLLLANPGQTLTNRGTLRQACNMGNSVRLILITASDVTVSGGSLDGQISCQTTDQHRAGVFVQAPTDTHITGVVIKNLKSSNFTGDGLYAFIAGDPADPANIGVTFDSVEVFNNHRNGITFGGLIDSAQVINSIAHDNRVQQIDSEGTYVNNITITGNTIDGTASNDYALTISGSTITHSHTWRVHDNSILGGVNAVWVDDVIFEHNTVTNASTKPGFTAWRDNGTIQISHNTISNTNPTQISNSLIFLSGTGTGSAPIDTTIDSNSLTTTSIAKAFGIRAEGCKKVTITNNTITGPGLSAPGYAGVYLRATLLNDDFLSARVHDNTIRNWGSLGLAVVGNSTAKLLSLEITTNTFDDTSSTPSQIYAIAPDADRLHAAKSVFIGGNTLTGGTTVLLSGTMTGAHTAWGDHWEVP